MTKIKTSKWYISEIKKVIKQYGEYTYWNKGADEVMDIPKYVKELQTLSDNELYITLKEIGKHDLSKPFMSAVLSRFEELPVMDKLIESGILNDLY